MLIIGIAGGTGSGKTTVVHQIMNELPETEVGIIAQDSYYKQTDNLGYDEQLNCYQPIFLIPEWAFFH